MCHLRSDSTELAEAVPIAPHPRVAKVAVLLFKDAISHDHDVT